MIKQAVQQKEFTMSEKTWRKIGLIILCMVIAVGSAFGLYVGYLFAVHYEDYGYIALMVVSVVAFVGAIFGIFYVVFGKKSQRDKKAERIRRPIKETIIWLCVTFFSGAGVVLTYFLGFQIYYGPEGLVLSLIVIFIAVCLFSLFALISGKSIRRENIADTILPSDVEGKVETERKV